MPIQGLPQFTLPGAEIAEIPKELSTILKGILEGKQKQQQLEQDQFSNEQLDKYRMGQLDLERQELPSKIGLHKAQEKYYSQGGGRGGVGLKDQMQLMQQAMRDNPDIDINKANEITSAWLDGKETLSDGTPAPKPSGNSLLILDRLNRGRTSASLITQNINARGAEAEIGALSKHAKEGIDLAGTTYGGYSIPVLADSFGSDDASQVRLGKVIASQAIQFEIAQIRNRLAQGQPSVTSTEMLMKESQQHIKSLYPRLTAKARNVASDILTKALEEGLNARQKVGIGASTAFKKGKEQSSNDYPSENAPAETSFMQSPEGKWMPVHNSRKQEALKLGFKEV